jgi:pterin-4a-carbinolamine dehydratase
MKSLIELALRRKKENLVELDMSKSGSEIIKQVGFPYTLNRIQDDIPIKAEEAKWENKKDNYKHYIERIYTFHTHKHMLYFINESIKKAYEVSHHPEMLITQNEIVVILYTHDVNDVTEQDIKLSRYFDDIYDDIIYIGKF